MKYFKHILSLVSLLNLENIFAAVVEPQCDLFAEISCAVQHATGFPSDIADLTVAYSGSCKWLKLQKSWSQALPAHYSDGFVQPLSDHRLVVFSKNGEITTIDNRNGSIMSIYNLPAGIFPAGNEISCTQVLPDDTLAIGATNGSLHMIDMKNRSAVALPYPERLGSIRAISYLQGDGGEEELIVAYKNFCFMINPYNLKDVRGALPIKNVQSLTRLSKNKICFSGITPFGSVQHAVIYDINCREAVSDLGIPVSSFNTTTIVQCGRKLAIAFACESQEVSFWKELGLGYEAHLFEKKFPLQAKNNASLTALEDAVAVHDGGTVKIIDEDARLLQVIPGRVHQSFSDGKNGLITLCRSKETTTLERHKKLTFQEDEQEEQPRKDCRSKIKKITGITFAFLGLSLIKQRWGSS